MSDRATQVLAEGLPFNVRRSFRLLADHGEVARTTLQHRARGRRSRAAKAQSQQYLSASEEQALVRFLLRQDALGRPVRIKHVRSIAFSLTCQRPLADRPPKPPGKNWPQLFYKRHANVIKARKSAALDWNRFNIYDKVREWYEVIGPVLQDCAITRNNVYNMDETGTMLSKLNTVKVLVGKDNQQGCRGARIKRTTVTAIECVSADGRYLEPMIIWPASTHRANWTTHPTPGWHYAFSDSGYTDSYLSLQWLKLVFDPQTREMANQEPRVLICDGFGTHETVEVLEFCFKNNIILCRLPSHTSHMLQPCDISIFGPLKAAYRDQVERLERGCVGAIGKEHFTSLYSAARRVAFTNRNIQAGWAKAGLFPFSPERVLGSIPKPARDIGASESNESVFDHRTANQATSPKTPVTPVSAGAVASLHELIKQDAKVLDEMSRQRLQRHVQKLANATQISFAERALLLEHNQFLAKVNNEAKARRTTRSTIIGTARVMSYKDLEMARTERAAKDVLKESKKTKRTKKSSNKASAAAEALSTNYSSNEKRTDDSDAKISTGDADADAMQRVRLEETRSMVETWQAPVARMW